jgi:hypothetical protein
LRLLHFPRFEDAAGFWAELNATCKTGELTVDLETHALLWDRYHGPRGYELDLAVALDGDRCVGIAPLVRSDTDPFGTPYWSLSDDFVIAREYFCRPEDVAGFVRALPPHYTDDLSCFYVPADTGPFVTEPGRIVDLREAGEAYLASVGHGARRNLRHVLRINADVEAELDDRVRRDELAELIELRLLFWKGKRGGNDEGYFRYCADKTMGDLALMDRAAAMGKLVALYLRLDGRLVAANFSVRREADRVDDYLCLRDDRPPLDRRSLGVLAIARNMDHCRALGIRWYDMSACPAPYKDRLVNRESYFYRPPFSVPEAGGKEPGGAR